MNDYELIETLYDNTDSTDFSAKEYKSLTLQLVKRNDKLYVRRHKRIRLVSLATNTADYDIDYLYPVITDNVVGITYTNWSDYVATKDRIKLHCDVTF